MLSRDTENVSLKYFKNIYQMLEQDTLLVHAVAGWSGGN